MSIKNLNITGPFLFDRRSAGKAVSCFVLLSLILGMGSCRKLVAIDEPINTVTDAEVFKTDKQAASAMAGVYSLMINKETMLTFSAGEMTFIPGLSSDELNYYISDQGYSPYANNNLIATSYSSTGLWSSAYTAIYRANAVIEGIAASKSTQLHDSVRVELTAEAKFVRAFCYFYLTNLFGDVPLALTINFNKTRNLAKAPQQEVYKQILQDLTDAQTVLPTAYPSGIYERIHPNKWVANALLARVHLYMGNYADAASQAAAVIGQSGVFSLENDLNQVFLTGSKEAIWQLQQNPGVDPVGTATPEAARMLPNPIDHGVAQFRLSDQLLSAFEPGDNRRTAWVAGTDYAISGQTMPISWFPYKYKVGAADRIVDPAAQPKEYYMVMRLAEMYLIRAEAEANGATGGSVAAITDLNTIRGRAGLPDLSPSLTPEQVIAAVAHERQIEFFGEWGHRWLDLKRTGKATEVLSQIPRKQPWRGDYQLLYPIPVAEIQSDPNLMQNKGY